MPKLSIDIKSKFSLEIKTVNGRSGPYDMADLFYDGFRFAQLTLIRGEQAKSFMQLLKRVGVELKVEAEHAKEKVSERVHNPKASVKKVVKKVARR